MTRKVRVAAIAIVLASLLATASCDSDQPLSIEGQQVDIYFNAFGAVVPLYRVWELSADFDNDGMPDDINGDGVSDEDDITLWCKAAESTNPSSVPWDFAFELSVLRAGSSVPEVLSSDVARNETGNKTPYDDRVQSGVGTESQVILDLGDGVCSNNPDRYCNPNGAGNSCGSGSCVAEERPSCSLDPDTVCDPNGQMPEKPCSAYPVGPNIFDLGFCTEDGKCSGDIGGFFPDCDNTVCADSNKGVCQSETIERRFRFNNATASSLSAASLTVLQTGPNVLTDLCTGDMVCIDRLVAVVNSGSPLDPPLGECPGDPTGALGIPVLDPATQDINPSSTIFGVDLKKGDTLIVTARLSDDVPEDGGIVPFLTEPGLQAVITVDGTQLVADEVVGNLTSTDPEGPAITFSYTSQ